MIKSEFLPDSEFYQRLIISQLFQFGILIFLFFHLERTSSLFFSSITILTLFKNEKYTYTYIDYFYWLFFFTYANHHKL